MLEFHLSIPAEEATIGFGGLVGSCCMDAMDASICSREGKVLSADSSKNP